MVPLTNARKKRGTRQTRVPLEFSRRNENRRDGCFLAFCCSVSLSFRFAVLAQEVEAGAVICKQIRSFGKQFFHGRGRRHFRQQLQAAIVLQTRTSRNEPAHV